MEAEGRDPEDRQADQGSVQLIDDGRFEEARAEIATACESEIGGIAPDIVGAEAYMWSIEHEALTRRRSETSSVRAANLQSF